MNRVSVDTMDDHVKDFIRSLRTHSAGLVVEQEGRAVVEVKVLDMLPKPGNVVIQVNHGNHVSEYQIPEDRADDELLFHRNYNEWRRNK